MLAPLHRRSAPPATSAPRCQPPRAASHDDLASYLYSPLPHHTAAAVPLYPTKRKKRTLAYSNDYSSLAPGARTAAAPTAPIPALRRTPPSPPLSFSLSLRPPVPNEYTFSAGIPPLRYTYTPILPALACGSPHRPRAQATPSYLLLLAPRPTLVPSPPGLLSLAPPKSFARRPQAAAPPGSCARAPPSAALPSAPPPVQFIPGPRAGQISFPPHPRWPPHPPLRLRSLTLPTHIATGRLPLPSPSPHKSFCPAAFFVTWGRGPPAAAPQPSRVFQPPLCFPPTLPTRSPTVTKAPPIQRAAPAPNLAPPEATLSVLFLPHLCNFGGGALLWRPPTPSARVPDPVLRPPLCARHACPLCSQQM